MRVLPGYRYSPSYAELSEATGATRGPVFRAVLRLERDGRVELGGPGRRICVRPADEVEP